MGPQNPAGGVDAPETPAVLRTERNVDAGGRSGAAGRLRWARCVGRAARALQASRTTQPVEDRSRQTSPALLGAAPASSTNNIRWRCPGSKSAKLIACAGRAHPVRSRPYGFRPNGAGGGVSGRRFAYKITRICLVPCAAGWLVKQKTIPDFEVWSLGRPCG